MPKNILLVLFYIFSFSCNTSDNEIEKNQSDHIEYSDEENDNIDETISDYPDDTYNATVEYYNPNTGTSRTYTLDIDVVNNSVTVIHFNNGGWLDETHIISGGELDDNGSTEIESDKGYIYKVTIDR